MLEPLVSIIIPTFNYGRFLPETLDNILAQSYQNWECIIIDDGSTDNTKDVVKNYLKDSRFVYLYQTNKGLSGARNTGLRNSNGKFIQLLDSDDKIEFRKIELQVNEILSNPGIDILYGSVRYFTNENPEARYFDLDGKLIKSWMPEVSGKGWDVLSSLIVNNIMVVNSPLFRKSIIQEIGYFNEELGAVEDWEFWLRCALKNMRFQYFYQKDTFALVRTHISMSRNLRLMQESTATLRLTLNEALQKIPQSQDLINANKELLYILFDDLIFQDIQKGLLFYGWKRTYIMYSWGDNSHKQAKKTLKYTRRYFKKKVLDLFLLK